MTIKWKSEVLCYLKEMALLTKVQEYNFPTEETKKKENMILSWLKNNYNNLINDSFQESLILLNKQLKNDPKIIIEPLSKKRGQYNWNNNTLHLNLNMIKDQPNGKFVESIFERTIYHEMIHYQQNKNDSYTSQKIGDPESDELKEKNRSALEIEAHALTSAEKEIIKYSIRNNKDLASAKKDALERLKKYELSNHHVYGKGYSEKNSIIISDEFKKIIIAYIEHSFKNKG